MRPANYEIVYSDAKWLVIRDLGPWDRFATVTNDAERVVSSLLENKALFPEQRLAYYDSEGNLDEIVFNERGFTGFRVATPRRQPPFIDLAAETKKLATDLMRVAGGQLP